MPTILLFLLVGLLGLALGVYSLVTGKVLTRDGLILLENSPGFYWAWIIAYALAAAVGFYQVKRLYKNWRR